MNLSFSTSLTSVQTVIDSTSLKAFHTCKRYYKYRIVDGWTKRDMGPHLAFGQYFHIGRETYEKAKAQGAEHNEALRVAVRATLLAAWDQNLNRPWNSGHPEKNRWNLIRSLVWYLDTFGQHDRLQTIILANGRPAVEQSFKFVAFDPADGEILTSPATGEQIMVAGHFDRVAFQGGFPYVCDAKTTGSQLDQKYWSQFTPDDQISLYTYAGRAGLMNVDNPGWGDKPVLPMQRDIQGVIIDAVKVKVTFTDFQRQEILRDNFQLEEWFAGFKYDVQIMAELAERNYWPMNPTACHNYGGCMFREVCSKTPGARKQFLETFYIRDIWDPMIPRE